MTDTINGDKTSKNTLKCKLPSYQVSSYRALQGLMTAPFMWQLRSNICLAILKYTATNEIQHTTYHHHIHADRLGLKNIMYRGPPKVS